MGKVMKINNGIEVKHIKDLCGFIYYATQNKYTASQILFTLSHDLNGLIGKHYGDTSFLPRTDGDAKYLFND